MLGRKYCNERVVKNDMDISITVTKVQSTLKGQ